MANIILDEQVTPAAPAAGIGTAYLNSGLHLLSHVDTSGNDWPYSPKWFTSTTADFTGTNVNTAQPVFNTTEDVLTIPASTSFRFKGVYHITTVGATGHQLGILFGGTATLTSIGYMASANAPTSEVLGALSTIWVTVATVINVTALVSAGTFHSVLLDGIVRVNAGGTFIPQYQWSAAPGTAGITLKNSYFAMWPVGSNVRAAIGPWG